MHPEVYSWIKEESERRIEGFKEVYRRQLEAKVLSIEEIRFLAVIDAASSESLQEHFDMGEIPLGRNGSHIFLAQDEVEYRESENELANRLVSKFYGTYTPEEVETSYRDIIRRAIQYHNDQIEKNKE